ncbi:hypothetical protein F4780DRAFT_766364 [Xylariomycetidae sp. FL0641]|nr:hypothetical protein F4780DRAFT_766364 [Xylariomycetidae sp. FL0641]
MGNFPKRTNDRGRKRPRSPESESESAHGRRPAARRQRRQGTGQSSQTADNLSPSDAYDAFRAVQDHGMRLTTLEQVLPELRDMQKESPSTIIVYKTYDTGRNTASREGRGMAPAKTGGDRNPSHPYYAETGYNTREDMRRPNAKRMADKEARERSIRKQEEDKNQRGLEEAFKKLDDLEKAHAANTKAENHDRQAKSRSTQSEAARRRRDARMRLLATPNENPPNRNPPNENPTRRQSPPVPRDYHSTVPPRDATNQPSTERTRSSQLSDDPHAARPDIYRTDDGLPDLEECDLSDFLPPP